MTDSTPIELPPFLVEAIETVPMVASAPDGSNVKKYLGFMLTAKPAVYHVEGCDCGEEDEEAVPLMFMVTPEQAAEITQRIAVEMMSMKQTGFWDKPFPGYN